MRIRPGQGMPVHPWRDGQGAGAIGSDPTGLPSAVSPIKTWGADETTVNRPVDPRASVRAKKPRRLASVASFCGRRQPSPHPYVRRI